MNVKISRERIETLFHEALQHAAQEREQFLRAACGPDETLHAELASLIAHYESAGSTFERPLIAPDAFVIPKMGATVSRIEPGEVLAGRFRIIRALASGGMGDVYEAQDEQLGDRVALKTIRMDVAANPRVLPRFKKEIQLAKRISHRNVCRIHDLGIDKGPSGEVVFLTMELLAGDTLAQRLEGGRLTLDEASEIATQISDGLNAAHSAGIVHRDLKSSNIILSERDSGLRVVITDFGIADAVNTNSSMALTLTGEIVGTPDYMAPEQLRGEATGPATDVYAFGLMLFEMITGQRAFTGTTPLSAAVKRLHDAPPSPRIYLNDIPQEWERAILRCLERDPAARFQSTGEVIRAIEKRHGSGIGERLQEKWRKFGSRRIIAVAILIVLAVAGVWVSIALLRHRGQPVHQPAPTSPQPPEAAAIHYKRGLYYWNLRTQDGFLNAIEEYDKAIQADPKYALAYSGLAWVYAMQSGAKAPRTVLPEAKKYAERAISLDAKLSEAHAALAFVRFYYDWDWTGAEDEYKRAIALKPGYPSAHSNYAILLAVRKRFREAEEQAKLAEEADPVSAAVATGLGRIYYWSGDSQRAIQQFESVLAMHPQFPEAHLSLASALEQKGDSEAAVRQISYVLSDSLNSSALADLGYMYARMNDKQLARGMLLKLENLRAERKRYVSPCYPAIVHAALGELDEAFDLLDQGLRERTFEMVYLNINREYSDLRQDRRWLPLVRSVGFAE